MESKLRSLTPQAPVGVGSCTEGERLPTSPDNVKELEEKFAAFVRDDMYGTMGQGQLPWQEKVLLGVALVTLVPIRVTVGMALVLFYYLICRVCTLFSAQEEEGYAHMGGWRRAVIVRTGMFLSRVMLFVLGFYRIKETFRNPETDGKSSGDQTEFRGQLEEPGRSGAIISNHTSYLDILYHMYSSFPSFVAKVLLSIGFERLIRISLPQYYWFFQVINVISLMC